MTRTTFIPLLVSAQSDRMDPAAVRDESFAGLAVVYTFGPDFGRRVVTHADLGQLQLRPQMLRQSAFQHLEVLSSRAEFHGQPPALMLSFEGLESSLLLANDFWARLEGAVPGELVVGVPARDCVVVTGSQSGPGLEKAKRCVERVFYAGGDHLISRGLLVRRGGAWEPFDRSARPSGRPTFGPAHVPGVGQPPRQFQEHPSYPGQRVLPAGGPRPGMTSPRRRPMYPGVNMDETGSHVLDQTGSHRLDQTGSHLLDQTDSHRMDQTGSHRLDQTGSHRFDQTGSHRFDQTGSHRLGMTGSQPAISAMTGQVMPASRPAMADGRLASSPPPMYADYSAEVAEAAQYSAVPFSAMPYADAAYAIAPQSLAPNAVAAHVGYGYADTGYSDSGYSTGSMPRIHDHEGPAHSSPTYPGSWGVAPESGSTRAEFRTGPRSRFSS